MAGRIGAPVIISGPGCRFPDVPYNSVDDTYLTVWADYNPGTPGVYGAAA